MSVRLRHVRTMIVHELLRALDAVSSAIRLFHSIDEKALDATPMHAVDLDELDEPVVATVPPPAAPPAPSVAPADRPSSKPTQHFAAVRGPVLEAEMRARIAAATSDAERHSARVAIRRAEVAGAIDHETADRLAEEAK